jgi:hypothetical protein
VEYSRLLAYMRMGLGFEMEGKEKGKGIRKGKGNGKHCAQYSYSMYEYGGVRVCVTCVYGAADVGNSPWRGTHTWVHSSHVKDSGRSPHVTGLVVTDS